MIAGILSIVTAIYGTAGGLAILLQARTMLAHHTSADVSLRFMGIYTGGYALFLAYGLTIASVTLIMSDGAGLICGIFTYVIAIRCHSGCAHATIKRNSR